MIASFSRPILRCWLAAAALGLALLNGPTVANVIHSDFDPGGTYYGGTEGWFNYAGNPGFATATPTGGSTLWLEVKPNQYSGNITSQNWATPDVTVATWNSNSHLDFDVIVDTQWIPNNAAQAISVELQVGGGVSGTVNKYANPTIDTSLKNTIQHVSIPLASLQPFDPTSTFWNLSFNLSPGYAWEWDSNNPGVQPYNPHYYIDNVAWVTVPEPASALLVVMGSVCGVLGIRPSGRRAVN